MKEKPFIFITKYKIKLVRSENLTRMYIQYMKIENEITNKTPFLNYSSPLNSNSSHVRYELDQKSYHQQICEICLAQHSLSVSVSFLLLKNLLVPFFFFS